MALFGTPEHSASEKQTKPIEERQKGVLGKLLASYVVTEVTGRKAKHGHGLSWGGAMPTMLANLVHVRELLADGGALRRALMSQSRTSLPFGVHVADSARQALQLGKRRFETFAPKPESIEELQAYGLSAAAVRQTHNWHHPVSGECSLVQ
jgi:hypothetical protein